jgi:hypothetical protein
VGLEAQVWRVLWREIKQAFPIFRHERVEIYQRTNSPRNSIGNASDYHAAVGVPAENHIREILPPEQVDNIRNMGRKTHSGGVEMTTFAQTRKSRREHLMAGVLKAFSYSLPTPATMPRPVHKHVSGLVLSLFIRSCQINNPPSY